MALIGSAVIREFIMAAARRLVSLNDTAEVLNVSVKTVRRYVAQGRLDAVRLGRRTFRVQVESVDRLIDEASVHVARRKGA
ncbi:MAG: helix-turn-helix domain-containing protein [Nocardioides sp.]